MQTEENTIFFLQTQHGKVKSSLQRFQDGFSGRSCEVEKKKLYRNVSVSSLVKFCLREMEYKFFIVRNIHGLITDNDYGIDCDFLHDRRVEERVRILNELCLYGKRHYRSAKI
jgi:hypothetical protein